MVKPEKVKQALLTLANYLQMLEILSKVPRSDFLEDFTKIESAKHLLQVSIENCLDINNHIIASEGYRAPKNYADSFEIMVEYGVLPSERLGEFKNMVRFRNRLVHLYWEIDKDAIYQILQENLDDFRIYTKSISDLLGKL